MRIHPQARRDPSSSRSRHPICHPGHASPLARIKRMTSRLVRIKPTDHQGCQLDVAGAGAFAIIGRGSHPPSWVGGLSHWPRSIGKPPSPPATTAWHPPRHPDQAGHKVKIKINTMHSSAIASQLETVISALASPPAGIPQEAGTTWNVILESSSDLLNWTPANPGEYSGTEPKRFFRTRMVKKP